MRRFIETLINRTAASYRLFPVPSWVGLGEPSLDEILERVAAVNGGRVSAAAGAVVPPTAEHGFAPGSHLVAASCAGPSR